MASLWLPPEWWDDWCGLPSLASLGCGKFGADPPEASAAPATHMRLGHATADPFADWRQLGALLSAAPQLPQPRAIAAAAAAADSDDAAAAAAVAYGPARPPRRPAVAPQLSEAAQWLRAAAFVRDHPEHDFVCIDTCAGSGAFTCGAQDAGVPVIGAIEGCFSAAATYRDNHPEHPVTVLDLQHIDEVVAFVLRVLRHYEATTGRQPRLVILASPPCQSYSLAGRQLGDADTRALVLPAIVAAGLRCGMAAIVVENVEPFMHSLTWHGTCRDLHDNGFTTDAAVVDTADLSLPQRRRRMIGIGYAGPLACGMRPAELALRASDPVTVADMFPDVKYFFYNGRFGKQIYSATDVSPALKCNCAKQPARNYRPRPRDAAPLAAATVFTISQLAAIQGFRPGYILPPRGRRCPCRFCSSNAQDMAGRQIGNAIAPPVAEWALRRLLEMSCAAATSPSAAAPLPAQTGSGAAPLQALATLDPAEAASAAADAASGAAMAPTEPPAMFAATSEALPELPHAATQQDIDVDAGAVRGTPSGPRGMNGGGDDAAAYSALFAAYATVARSLPAPRVDRRCISAFGYCSCTVCVLEPLLGTEDPWAPERFADATSCHMQQVRRATRKALYRQLQRSDVRRDNTRTDFRSATWDGDGRPEPRASDPRAMLAGYTSDVPVYDDDAPTQCTPTSRQHRWWLRLHRASCAVCSAHERAHRFTPGYGGTPLLEEDGTPVRDADGRVQFATPQVSARPAHAAPGCYGRWMIHSIRCGFDPLFDAEREYVDIPNHQPVYADWPATVKYFAELEHHVPWSMSEASWHRPPRTSPLLTIIRPHHRRRAEARGEVPKARVCLDVKAGLLNCALADWLFLYEDVGSVVRLIRLPGCVCAKLDLRKYFLQLAASPQLQEHLWFSDPRHEPRWGGRGPPPDSWSKPPRHARWRKFLTCIFGLKVLPAYANMLSGEVCRFLRMMGCTSVTYLTDDFFIVAETLEECRRFVRIAIAVYALIGLESPPDKNEGPYLVGDFLGVTVDSRGELTASWDRLDTILVDMRTIVRHGTVVAEELRRVAGVLSFLTQYLRGANAFLRSTWDLLATAEDDSQVLHVTTAFVADMAWWEYGITRRLLSGSRIFLHGCSVKQELFYSDGSGSGRYGFVRRTAAHLGLLVWGALPERANHHVPYVELFAVWTAAMMFAHQWSGLVVVFGVDSAPICSALNKASSPDQPLLLLLRFIAALQSVYRFDFVAEHVTRSLNGLADCATRFVDLQEFRPFLADAGYSTAAVEATPLRSRWRSPLASGCLFGLPLGRQRQ